MSLHYYIDGYNLIWSSDRFGTGALHQQRERLLRFLEDKRPSGSLRNDVTVVFDGKEDVESPPWRGTVSVIFSRGRDADAVIKQKVDDLPNPRIAVVVTDDRDIQRWVRAAKARVLSCAEFLQGAAKKSPPARSRATLNRDAIDDINSEFKKLWKL